MESPFLNSIELSLSEWPAFQIAIDQGMGGDKAKEKETWMAGVIRDLFHENRGDVDVSDVSDYVGQILDAEFSTVIEDGSLDMLSARLCYFYRLQSQGKEADLIAINDRKRSELNVKAAAKAQETINITNEMIRLTTAESDSDQGVASGSNEGNPNNEDVQMSDIDDSWTVVSNKKKPNKRK